MWRLCLLAGANWCKRGSTGIVREEHACLCGVEADLSQSRSRAIVLVWPSRQIGSLRTSILQNMFAILSSGCLYGRTNLLNIRKRDLWMPLPVSPQRPLPLSKAMVLASHTLLPRTSTINQTTSLAIWLEAMTIKVVDSCILSAVGLLRQLSRKSFLTLHVSSRKLKYSP